MYINGTEEFWAYTKQSIDSFKRFSYCILIYFVRVVEVDPRMPRHVHGSACGSGFSMWVCRVELRWLGLGASTCTWQPWVSCNAYNSDYSLVRGCLGGKSANQLCSKLFRGKDFLLTIRKVWVLSLWSFSADDRGFPLFPLSSHHRLVFLLIILIGFIFSMLSLFNVFNVVECSSWLPSAWFLFPLRFFSLIKNSIQKFAGK